MAGGYKNTCQRYWRKGLRPTIKEMGFLNLRIKADGIK
jgi:hypothetical protein